MVDETNNVENDDGFEEWRERQRIAINVVNLAMADFLETCRTYDVDPDVICTVLATVKFMMSRDMSKKEKDLCDYYGEQLAIKMQGEAEEQEKAQMARDAVQQGFVAMQFLPILMRK